MMTHELNTHDKITEIMELAGVLPGDLDRSRRNFERLPESEIDRRLGDLRSAAKKVAEWRTIWRNAAAEPKAEPVVVDTGDAIQAFAALENEVSDLKPPMIIGVNPEGATLARAIKRDLPFRPAIIEIRADAAGGISFVGEPHALPKNAIVAILGHYVNSGRTMAAVADYIRDRFAPKRVHCLALAASPAGARWVEAHNHLFFHLDASESARFPAGGSDRISLTDLETFPGDMNAAIKRERAHLPAIRDSLRQAGLGRG